MSQRHLKQHLNVYISQNQRPFKSTSILSILTDHRSLPIPKKNLCSHPPQDSESSPSSNLTDAQLPQEQQSQHATSPKPQTTTTTTTKSTAPAKPAHLEDLEEDEEDDDDNAENERVERMIELIESSRSSPSAALPPTISAGPNQKASLLVPVDALRQVLADTAISVAAAAGATSKPGSAKDKSAELARQTRLAQSKKAACAEVAAQLAAALRS